VHGTTQETRDGHQTSALAATTFFFISLWAQTVHAQATSSASTGSLTVPLTMIETVQQTEKTMLQVGVGSLQPLSMGVDTGSVGLVLLATPGIPGNGTSCFSHNRTDPEESRLIKRMQYALKFGFSSRCTVLSE
jgi:hypothetical protein